MNCPTFVKAASILLLLGGSAAAQQPTSPLSFFVTSANPGKGADFGGLAGADAHCQALAQAVGAGGERSRRFAEHSRHNGSNADGSYDPRFAKPAMNC